MKPVPCEQPHAAFGTASLCACAVCVNLTVAEFNQNNSSITIELPNVTTFIRINLAHSERKVMTFGVGGIYLLKTLPQMKAYHVNAPPD